LRLADLGYFKVKVFERLNRQGVWWVSRLPARSGIWQDDRVMHLAEWLKEHDSDCIDQPVELTAQRLPCRLLAFRLPPDVAEERRQRVRKAASKRKKSHLKPETLALCAWTILVTNLPPDAFSPEDILCLQRLRWQIELLFKLWKSELSLDEWRSQQPHQILSEVYAKLLLTLVQHWLLLLGCWHQENRSLVKAATALRKHAFHILAALPDFAQLLRALHLILPTLARCTIQKRKTRPATFQTLGRASP
jgi:IS4 transposase